MRRDGVTGRFVEGPGRKPGSRNRREPDEAVRRALVEVIKETDLAQELRTLRDCDPVAFLRLCSDFARMRPLPAIDSGAGV